MRTAMSTIDCTDRPVDAALWLARRFAAGGRLVVDAPNCPDHAHHVAVEFIHPVVAGCRPLPAIVDAAATTSACGPADSRLAIGDADNADLTISDRLADAEIMRSYHVLWELVQVCLEHPGLVGVAAAAGGDSTGFLYPFLDAAETDEDALRASLATSAVDKHGESRAIAAAALDRNRVEIEAAAASIADAAEHGGRIFTMGNGGSSTDAARLVRMFSELDLDTTSISADYAVLSALANDLGAEHIYTRQLEALARPGDVLIGCSTSGASANLLEAFRLADSRSVVGIGISGYRGGAFVHEAGVDHCLTIDSASVHRIQEGQAALTTAMGESVERRVAAP